MHEIEPPLLKENICIATFLWTETRPNIIVDLLFAISTQMLGPTGPKKRKERSDLGSFTDVCLHNCGL